MLADSALRVVPIFPDLLGTYGDGGNAAVVQRRAARRGIATETVLVYVDGVVPAEGDIYLLGGGEDRLQLLAAERLRGPAGDGLRAAVERGKPVLAVCAGFQILGRSFLDPSGLPAAGLGLLDVVSDRSAERAVGEIVAEPAASSGLPVLTGYENHAGCTDLGPAAEPLGRTIVGVGNRRGRGDEGAVQGSIVATYLHGPVLVRNPGLADHLLEQVTGPLPELVDPLVDQLRAERITSALAERPARPRWRQVPRRTARA